MLTFRNIKPINYYKSLDKLKILTFWQIIKDKNIFLLDLEHLDGKKYTKEQMNHIEETWLNLYDEYYVLLDDSSSRSKMSKSFNELKVRSKIEKIKENYDFLLNLLELQGKIDDEVLSKYEQETYKRIKLIDKRIKPLFFDGIRANLNNLDKVLKSLINLYNIEHKESKKAIQKEIDNVYEVVANAESWLERSIPIDEMVVSHWVAIQNQIKQKQKAQHKNGK